jgi:hypothetical protein
MSVGNTTQAIDFDRSDLTLVLGENLDMGGDGSRNGTGPGAGMDDTFDFLNKLDQRRKLSSRAVFPMLYNL